MDEYASATEIARRVRRGELSAETVVAETVERIESRSDGAYVWVGAERARRRARAVDERVASGESVGPLAGVPVAVKDLYGFVEGAPQTFGSQLFADNVADENSVFVDRLEAAGAVVIGMTNTPEFGHKGVTDNALHGPTRNPFDPARNPGGSSGGSAAALAAGTAAVAHGGDAGGSLRIPAAWSGVYAIKPTYRRVPAVGRPNGFGGQTGTFVHYGPMARTVADAAVALDVMSGPHPRDPTTLPATDERFADAVGRGIEGLRVGYTPDYGAYPVDERVRETVSEAVEAFADAGATVERVEIALGYDHERLTEVWRTLSGVGFAAMADRLADEEGVDLLGRREAIADEFAAMIERGQATSGPEFYALGSVKTAVFDAFRDAFDAYDLVVGPTVTHPPVANADRAGRTLGPSEVAGESVDPTIGWCPTYLQNFTGHPAA
ncbi:MAG: amidase, partial [Halobaculum sp.]